MHMHRCNGGPCRGGSDGAASRGAIRAIRTGHSVDGTPNSVMCPNKVARHMVVAHPWPSCHARTRGNTNNNKRATSNMNHCVTDKMPAFSRISRDDSKSGDRGVQQGEVATRVRMCA